MEDQCDRLLFSLKENGQVFTFEDSYLQKCDEQRKGYPFFFKNLLLFYISTPLHSMICCDQDECIFKDDKRIYFSGDYFSDGNWVWSVDLIHYTKYHFFRWPKEFTDELKGRLFLRPFRPVLSRKKDFMDSDVFVDVLNIEIMPRSSKENHI